MGLNGGEAASAASTTGGATSVSSRGGGSSAATGTDNQKKQEVPDKVKKAIAEAKGFIESSGGGLKNFRVSTSDSRDTKRLGSCTVYCVKGEPKYIAMRDQAFVGQYPMTCNSKVAQQFIVQESVKEGDVLQLPGAILTRAIMPLLDLQALKADKREGAKPLKLLVGWPCMPPTEPELSIDGFENMASAKGHVLLAGQMKGDVGLLAVVRRAFVSNFSPVNC